MLKHFRSSFSRVLVVAAGLLVLASAPALAGLKFAATLRNSMVQTIQTAIDGGAGAGIIGIYSGTEPGTCAALSGNTLLAQLTFSDPSAPSALGGILTFSAITQDSSADATGTATFFRLYSSADGTTISDPTNCVVQGTVTATGGGGDITFTTTSFVSGQPVTLTSWTVTAPGQ